MLINGGNWTLRWVWRGGYLRAILYPSSLCNIIVWGNSTRAGLSKNVPNHSSSKMGMKVFIRSQYTTLPLIVGPQINKRIRMKSEKDKQDYRIPKCSSLASPGVHNYWSPELWNGNWWFQNDRENKRVIGRTYKKYKPLNDAENVHIHHLYLG